MKENKIHNEEKYLFQSNSYASITTHLMHNVCLLGISSFLIFRWWGLDDVTRLLGARLTEYFLDQIFYFHSKLKIPTFGITNKSVQTMKLLQICFGFYLFWNLRYQLN